MVVFLQVLIIIGVNFKLILCAKLFFPKTIFFSFYFFKRIFYTVLADLAGIWRDLKKSHGLYCLQHQVQKAAIMGCCWKPSARGGPSC
jgi:hypothetical protein